MAYIDKNGDLCPSPDYVASVDDVRRDLRKLVSMLPTHTLMGLAVYINKSPDWILQHLFQEEVDPQLLNQIKRNTISLHEALIFNTRNKIQ